MAGKHNKESNIKCDWEFGYEEFETKYFYDKDYYYLKEKGIEKLAEKTNGKTNIYKSQLCFNLLNYYKYHIELEANNISRLYSFMLPIMVLLITIMMTVSSADSIFASRMDPVIQYIFLVVVCIIVGSYIVKETSKASNKKFYYEFYYNLIKEFGNEKIFGGKTKNKKGKGGKGKKKEKYNNENAQSVLEQLENL